MSLTAFDADALIYAAIPGHPLGRRIAALFSPRARPRVPAGYGSYLLVPELLSKPLRDGSTTEVRALTGLLSRLNLQPLDGPTARLAATFGASYKLKATDATHLATAVASNADRFITNNAKDFPKSIPEIDIVYPAELDDPGPR